MQVKNIGNKIKWSQTKAKYIWS